MANDDDLWRELRGLEGAGARFASAEERFNAVLRALGSLLVTLGGESRPPTGAAAPRPARAPLPGAAPRAASAPRPPRVPGYVPASPPVGETDIDLVLQDARERAHRIIDESVEQAQALLGRGDGSLDAVQRSLVALTADVRDIRGRLERIEALLRGAAPPAAEPPAARPPVAEPLVRAPVAEPPFRAPVASPAPPPAPAPREAAPPPAASPAAAAAPVAPPRPLSVVPPPPARPVPAETSAASPPPAREAVGQSAPPAPARRVLEPPPSAPPPPAAAPPAAEPPAASGVDRFAPDAGSVTLRVSPVSGFQGLMRVQDALAHLAAVREAAVEAYSQGEARLRIQLREPVTTTEIAAGLAGRLGQRAHVEGSSSEERTMRVALG